MPVEFAAYDPQPTDFRWMRDPDSNPYRIVRFLGRHPETGFTPKEIAEATDVPRGSVGTTLSRLEEQGLVRHKEPYWAIVEDDRVAAIEAMVVSTETEAVREDAPWTEVDEEAWASEEEMAAWRRRQDAER